MAIFKRKLDDEEMQRKTIDGLNILCNNLKKTYVKYMTNLGAYIFHYGKFVIIKSLNIQSFCSPQQNSFFIKKLIIRL